MVAFFALNDLLDFDEVDGLAADLFFHFELVCLEAVHLNPVFSIVIFGDHNNP